MQENNKPWRNQNINQKAKIFSHISFRRCTRMMPLCTLNPDTHSISPTRSEIMLPDKYNYKIMLYTWLGERIVQGRKEKKITQKELAEKLNISVSLLRAYERGEKKMSLEKFVDLCEALGFAPFYFLCDSFPFLPENAEM